MKKFGNVIIGIVVGIVVFIINGLIVEFICGDNEISAGAGLTFYLAIPTICGILIAKRRKNKTSKSSDFSVDLLKKSEGENVVNKIPKSRKKREEKATWLYRRAQATDELASEAKSISLFVDYYNEMLAALKELSLYEGKVSNLNGSPSLEYHRRRSDFQWKLRCAIERQKDDSIDRIVDLYKNSKEHKERTYLDFLNEIDEHKEMFSDETTEFAEDAILAVKNAAGFAAATKWTAHDDSWISEELSRIDNMEGHNFEKWCANLLRKNNFINVEVTKGSGDQGIDVLAEKDGIKYAIQCKCYAADLGNTPIQEAYAGASFYHCQIAAVMTNRYFTTGGKEAAKATGVLLWDRRKIQELLENAN